MLEAQKCDHAGAYLAAVILLGSVLEGLCEGFGRQNANQVKAAFRARYREDAPRPEKWVLAQWIAVLGDLGHLSPNIEKFGHALRDFRNYVHPSAELDRKFSINQDTAKIGLQVVMAAVNDLARASSKQKKQDHG